MPSRTTRAQVNLSYSMPSNDLEQLEKLASQMGESTTTIARELLSERIRLLEAGWGFRDDLLSIAFEVLATIPKESREAVFVFLSEKFPEHLQLTRVIKRVNGAPTALGGKS